VPEPAERPLPSLPRPKRPPIAQAPDVPNEAETLRPRTPRTEPGTWREIIARFEHELDDVPAGEPADVVAGAPATAETRADQPTARQPPVVEGVAPGAEVEAEAEVEPEDALPLETPWEFEGMTTPDYRPSRSIHDPEHDSWPVEAEDGDAVPAWGIDEGEDDPFEHDPSRYGEIGEMVLDDVVRPDPWDVEPEGDDAPARERDFPLNAFIVPAGVRHVPSGYDNGDVAQRVAHRLDELARQLRSGGLRALGQAESADELSRVLAAIVTGYVSRDA
jgi:hypothetical protein